MFLFVYRFSFMPYQKIKNIFVNYISCRILLLLTIIMLFVVKKMYSCERHIEYKYPYLLSTKKNACNHVYLLYGKCFDVLLADGLRCIRMYSHVAAGRISHVVGGISRDILWFRLKENLSQEQQQIPHESPSSPGYVTGVVFTQQKIKLRSEKRIKEMNLLKSYINYFVLSVVKVSSLLLLLMFLLCFHWYLKIELKIFLCEDVVAKCLLAYLIAPSPSPFHVRPSEKSTAEIQTSINDFTSFGTSRRRRRRRKS